MKFPLLILFLFPSFVFSQAKFDRKTDIPVSENSNQLAFPWAGGINFPFVSQVDMNNDGLQDLFMFDHHNDRLLTFVNNGNSDEDLAWDYAPQYRFSFPEVNVWAFLYDYDCDGLSDFFTLSSRPMCSGIMAYKNMGNLQWQVVDSCLQAFFVSQNQNVFANSVSLPHFNDMDGDGDMDIIGYNTLPDGRVLYYRNMSMENFANCDSLKFNLSTVCWGNFQLKIGGNNVVGCFHCPCRIGRPHADENNSVNYDELQFQYEEPKFDPTEAAKRDDTVSSLFALDLDNDGHKELLVGDISTSNTLMIHNNAGEMDSQDTLFPSYDSPAFFNGFHYHSYFDADNDGKKDLLAVPYDHENKNGMWLYKNTGTSSLPVFGFASDNFLQKNMIDVGEDACPVFFDHDNDGLEDIIFSKGIFDEGTNTVKTGMYYYRNNGTASSPSYEFVTDDYEGLTGLYTTPPTYPAFGDLDNDGDKDMLIGLENGHLHYYQNIAAAGSPADFQGPVSPQYMGIDVGKYATPQLFDVNKDGILDILCGSQRGFVNYFKNRGTVSSPLFDTLPTNDTLGCIVLQMTGTTDGYTVPFMYDSLGNTRLLVASANGNINQYDQIDGNLNGCFNLAGKVYQQSESSRVKFNITVNGADVNGDSLTDIIVGQSTGGAEILYQRDPFASVLEISPAPQFDVYPNPANDFLKIRFRNVDLWESKLRLYNSLGEVVLSRRVKSISEELNTSTLSPGIYLVQLISDKYTVGKKIVIKR